MFKKVVFCLVLAGMSSMASATIVISTTRTTVTSNGTGSNALLFAGTAAGCSKPASPNDPDCCSTTGWGSNPALNLCTASERNLATARNESRAVYIGDTCLQENGSCKAALSVYCVYPDRVTYLFQVEGRRQLGLGFGTPALPDCGGLTEQQVEGIDLTKIDFSPTASPFVVLQSAQS